MGAVVSFVGDVIGGVVDAVGDVVETVVDVVGDVVETVVDTVQAVIEDPLPTLLAIAGQAVGIPAPVTMAAVTAAKGGDLEDIVLSAGTAYFAPQVSNAISTTLSSTIGDSIINQTVSDTVVKGVSNGLVSGTVAEIRGGDFSDAFAGSFTGTVVNSSVGEFTNEFIKPEISDMLSDSGLDVKTINTLVNEGTRAVSAGITAEVTGRGDFDDAFINSVQNSTINIGTNYASNTITNEFKTIETGLRSVEEDNGTSEGTMSWGDYENLETTRDQDYSSAGINDDLVDEVEVSDLGQDSGNATQAVNDMWQDNYYQDVIGSSQKTIDEFTQQPTVDIASADEEVSEFGATDEEEQDQLADIDWGLYDFTALPEDLQSLFDFNTVETASDETPVGGLAGASQDYEYDAYAGEEPTQTAKTKAAPFYDPYEGLTDEDFGLVDASTVDVAGPDIQGADVAPIIEGGLNKTARSLVDTGTSNIGDSALNLVMKNIVTPSIRQGLTKAIKGTPTRRVVQAPSQVQRPKAKATLTPDQMAQIRGALSQQQRAPAQKIDMSKIMAQTKKPTYVPPKKVDVSKLTPVTNVASLTALLGKKG